LHCFRFGEQEIRAKDQPLRRAVVSGDFVWLSSAVHGLAELLFEGMQALQSKQVFSFALAARRFRTQSNPGITR
jgi:hypothetical protein